MMRGLFAVFLLLHGAAHLVGFAGSWRLSSEIPYHTTLLGGRLDAGDAGIRLLGVLWLLTALAFAAAAGAVLFESTLWRGLTLAVAGASLMLSALHWPEARVGVALNVAIIAGIAMLHA
jgi:hypothetical protein